MIKIGRMVNKSDEDISTRIFTDDIRSALINSGDVKVVASSDETENSREERRDQDVNASAETRRESFQETGCDVLLTGSIDVQHDIAGERKQKFYSVNSESHRCEVAGALSGPATKEDRQGRGAEGLQLVEQGSSG